MSLQKSILIILLICIPLLLDAQASYKVIRVDGSIVYVRTGNSMSQGDVFAENENLSFGSPTSRAAVINPEKGRFILQPDNTNDLKHAKTHFLPGMNNISTRGGAFNNLQDLQNHFKDTLVIINRASLAVNPYAYPMDDNHFFYLTFLYNGEQINKKLGYNVNQMLLDRNEILRVDDKPIHGPDTPAMTLSYSSDGAYRRISDFSLSFPDPAQLKNELSIILDGLAQASYTNKVNEVSGYLSEFYGTPDKKDVMQYLENEFGLKREE